jgi:hypothetical protein
MLSAAHTWSLAAIAIVAAFAMLWAFGRCSDQAAIRIAKRKVRAHLVAFRLFADEPSQILRSQKQLLVWNLRYLALMLRPTAVTILPLALLLFHLDAVYGRRPLAAGESAIVTAQLASGFDLQAAQVSLQGHRIAVETPSLRLPSEHQVCWRVRAESSATGTVSLRLPGASAEKLVQAGTGLVYLSERRVASLPAWLLYPREARLLDAPFDSITLDYPSAQIPVFGFGVHWLVWFCIVSFATMLAFRRRLRVTF